MDITNGKTEAVLGKKEIPKEYSGNEEKAKKSKKKFLRSRKELRELLDRKKKEKRAEEKAELKNIKNETEVWKVINKRKERRAGAE